MVNSFSSYRYIPAERIIKSNIRHHKIKEDLNALLKILKSIKSISVSNIREGSHLDQTILDKLADKPELLDLLIYFGYVGNNQDEFVYESPKSEHERLGRLNGIKEFQQFYRDLKDAVGKSLAGLEEFLRNSNRKSYVNNDDEFDKQDNFRKSSSLSRSGLEANNKETLRIIDSLKQSLVTKYNAAPSRVFILRKLALLVFKQTYPDSIEAGDESINMTIDQKLHFLSQNDKEEHIHHTTDDIYLDCLIRSNFKQDTALNLLRSDRPDFTKLVSKSISCASSKNSIANSVSSLKRHRHLLNRYKNENSSVDQYLREGDKWRLVQHIGPAIQKLRGTMKNASMDEVIVSKIHRMLFSELSSAIDRQVSVRIETISSILCELSLEAIHNLDISAVKSVVTLTQDIRSESFRTAVMNILSITCPICMNIFPRSQMETMLLCDHMCCVECIKSFYETNIKIIDDRTSLNKLTCIIQEHEIENDQKMSFFIFLEAKLKRWFSDKPEILKLYQEKLFYATRGKQIKKCGNPKCVSYFDIDQNNTIDDVRCPHCRFSQCRQCNRKWFADHKNLTCEEYEEWLINNDPDDADVQAFNLIKETAFACPNPECQYIYDFEPGGCEHFTCTQCKTDFCRMCSLLFYSEKKTKCPQANCDPKKGFHSHCPPNCFRETRDADMNKIIELLNNHGVNITQELNKKRKSTNDKCSLVGCVNLLSPMTQSRFCEPCYKLFLCSIVWRQQLEPWELYEDKNLQQLLKKASVPIPAKVSRKVLIKLCQRHLNQSLGKPKKLRRPRM